MAAVGVFATMVQGRCLCGKVRYKIGGALSNADHCHCSKCRRQHGAAFATYADCKTEGFQWLCGQDLVRIYEVESGVGWCFCINCGSTLAGTTHGQITSITLGTVDGDPMIRPGAHIFVASKAPWFEITDQLPQHKTRPSRKSSTN